MPTTLTEALREARMELAQAETRADDPDAVRDHCRAARERLDDCLVECPVCSRLGLPNRILAHDC